MARYTTKPPRSLGDWNDEPLLPNVHVREIEAVDTGLLNAKGEAIFRTPLPVGFGRDTEW